tara:strand:- start:634 stop:1833 length:1200 start_codon:yes stop_codon:yes gene_type:complete
MPLTFFGYYLLNGSIKIPLQSKSSDSYYFVKQSGTWGWRNPHQIAVGDYFLEEDGTELEITSKTEVQQDLDWYSLDVEDIDTYFSSNILVHNLPPKCCFVKGTKITMRDYSQKNIEDVEIGDLVLTYDIENKELVNNVVLATSSPVNKNFVRITFEDGTINENVLDHPYWVVDKGWSSVRPDWTKETHKMDCEQLNVGDVCLKSIEDDKVLEQKITKIEKFDKEQITYNLTIENTENYFANDILVHNKFPGCGGLGRCFIGHTMITLSDGTYQRIENLKPGDEIKTYNVETGKLENEIIEMITAIRHDNLVTYKLDNNTKITATLDHPFFIAGDSYVDSDYRPLTIGDKVKNDELNILEVVEIELNQGVEVTYNIEKTRNGNYFANKVLVSDESEIPFT